LGEPAVEKGLGEEAVLDFSRALRPLDFEFVMGIDGEAPRLGSADLMRRRA
jgi:hypothetical protein